MPLKSPFGQPHRLPPLHVPRNIDPAKALLEQRPRQFGKDPKNILKFANFVFTKPEAFRIIGVLSGTFLGP
jgi:hypothetical protein